MADQQAIDGERDPRAGRGHVRPVLRVERSEESGSRRVRYGVLAGVRIEENEVRASLKCSA